MVESLNKIFKNFGKVFWKLWTLQSKFCKNLWVFFKLYKNWPKTPDWSSFMAMAHSIDKLSMESCWSISSTMHVSIVRRLVQFFSFCSIGINKVDFIPLKINIVWVNRCQNQQKMWIVSQYAGSGEVSFLKRKDLNKNIWKMKSVYSNDCIESNVGAALHKEFLEGRETAELCDSQCNRSILSTKININTVGTLIGKNCSLTYQEMATVMDCSKSIIEKVMKKTRCAVCYFDVSPASFNETATSTMCWCLHVFEKQISRWPFIQVLCYHMWWYMDLSSWL